MFWIFEEFTLSLQDKVKDLMHHRKVFLISANYVEKKDDRKLEYKIEEIS